MFRQPKILALSGSLKQNSLNTRLLRGAAEMAQSFGAEVTIIDMNRFPLPIFNEDLEREGFPSSAKDLKNHFNCADGFIIASPEYNGSISPLLCNTISWMSRRANQQEALYASFKGKVSLILSASPGALGWLILPSLSS
jgi:chromate reductase, NAD(P)H dehydrogenase (quinone)